MTDHPDHCIVEVPAVVSSWGTRGSSVGSSPDVITALCTRIAGQDLAVEAAEQTVDETLRREADYPRSSEAC